VKVVLAITLSGTLIIALALIVGIVVHRKKFRRKEEMVATESREVENEPKRLFYQGH
jgi:hypothetical protein